jgi:hypothetical protein
MSKPQRDFSHRRLQNITRVRRTIESGTEIGNYHPGGPPAIEQLPQRRKIKNQPVKL